MELELIDWLSSGDVDADGNEEDSDKAKEENSVYEYGYSAGLQVAKINRPVVAGELEQKPRRQ